MRSCFYLLFCSIFCFYFSSSENRGFCVDDISKQIFKTGEKEIVVIVPSYNNKKWYKKNLDSIFFQKYRNYSVIYIDDKSTDGTGQLVEDYIREWNLESKVNLIQNQHRHGALANLYYAINSCDDNAIIILMDGDDWFKHEHVLEKINEIYRDKDIWMSYGQFQKYPSGQIGKCRQIPQYIIDNNLFREYEWVSSHLRTFYAWLFKKIEREDLLFKGEFFPMAWDLAFMFPMLEMAAHHFKFVCEVLYVYNMANPLNDHKVDEQFQLFLDRLIRAKHRYDQIGCT